MKHFINAIFAIVLGLAVTVSMAEQRESAKQPIVQKTPTTWLYLLVTKHGAIVKNDKGYQLVLNRKDLQTALMFSDRPARITHHITADELQKSWKLGKNSFQKDPPNASITIDGRTQLVVLQGIHVTANSIQFPITPISITHSLYPDQGSHIVILIDEVNIPWFSRLSEK